MKLNINNKYKCLNHSSSLLMIILYWQKHKTSRRRHRCSGTSSRCCPLSTRKQCEFSSTIYSGEWCFTSRTVFTKRKASRLEWYIIETKMFTYQPVYLAYWYRSSIVNIPSSVKGACMFLFSMMFSPYSLALFKALNISTDMFIRSQHPWESMG